MSLSLSPLPCSSNGSNNHAIAATILNSQAPFDETHPLSDPAASSSTAICNGNGPPEATGGHPGQVRQKRGQRRIFYFGDIGRIFFLKKIENGNDITI